MRSWLWDPQTNIWKLRYDPGRLAAAIVAELCLWSTLQSRTCQRGTCTGYTTGVRRRGGESATWVSKGCSREAGPVGESIYGLEERMWAPKPFFFPLLSQGAAWKRGIPPEQTRPATFDPSRRSNAFSFRVRGKNGKRGKTMRFLLNIQKVDGPSDLYFMSIFLAWRSSAAFALRWTSEWLLQWYLCTYWFVTKVC